MLLELFLFLLLGIFFGIITGLIPGLHVNIIGTLIVSSSLFFLADIDVIFLIIFIVSMSITHVFIDFIPSIFLGAPESGTELSVLPGHEMLKQGLGHQAVRLTAFGCLLGLFIFILLIFPLSFISKVFSDGNLMRLVIPLVLTLVSLNVIFAERRKPSAFFAFMLTGVLGLIVLNLELNEPLVPLLTGLFGMSSVLLSIQSKTQVPKQKTSKKIKIKKARVILASAIFSPLSLFFPALSSGQIAVIGNRFTRSDKKEFLFMLGLINILTMCFSFLALFLISKTRTGSSAAIKQLIGVPELNIFILITATILISGLISFFIVNFLSKKFVIILEKVNYTKISYYVIGIMFIVTFFISGFFGLIVLAVSAATGIYCITLGVSRINMMGCLLLPTIFIYLMA